MERDVSTSLVERDFGGIGEKSEDEHHPVSAEANRIVQKLWSYCTVLLDDGLSYGDYLEQLSVLLLLKLAR